MGSMSCAASSPQPRRTWREGGRLIIEFGFGQAPALGCGRTSGRLGDRADGPRPAGHSARGRSQEVGVENCLFCRIVSGEIPATIVFQDDAVVAFKDITPQAPMHVLVIPRRHVASLNELTGAEDEIVGRLVRTGAAIAKDAGLRRRRLSHGVQLQRRRGPDRVPHPPARARRTSHVMASWLDHGFGVLQVLQVLGVLRSCLRVAGSKFYAYNLTLEPVEPRRTCRTCRTSRTRTTVEP